jgi:dATP pyrophosphohydrolase
MNVRYDLVQCHVVRPREDGGWEFLQLLRAPGRYMAGTWQLVSGSIEPGETAWQAALRELKEETALVPRELYQLDLVNTFYMASADTLAHVVGFCAIVARSDEVRLNPEHTAHRWTRLEQIVDKLMWPGERAAVVELCREILDNGPAKAHLRISVPSS